VQVSVCGNHVLLFKHDHSAHIHTTIERRIMHALVRVCLCVTRMRFHKHGNSTHICRLVLGPLHVYLSERGTQSLLQEHDHTAHMERTSIRTMIRAWTWCSTRILIQKYSQLVQMFMWVVDNEFAVWVWGYVWRLSFHFEVAVEFGVWVWSLSLKIEFIVWVYSFSLEFEFENWVYSLSWQF